MGWSGSLTSSSAVGASITFTPDNPESVSLTSNFTNVPTYAGNYHVTSFTAPKKGVYKFVLKGSGGARINASKIDGTSATLGGETGGTGGTTTGYLLLEANQTVYVGAGGVCRAAFVSSTNGSSLAAISSGNLYFVAGAGGSGGGWGDANNWTGYNCIALAGGNGGGSSGAAGATYSDSIYGGKGGTSSAGGAGGMAGGTGIGNTGTYGTGGNSAGNGVSNYWGLGGRGGDGYYGGGGGCSRAKSSYGRGCGGGGGSGYVKTSSLTYNGVTYTSSTSQGGGAGCNGAGSVTITLQAVGELPITYNGTKLTELYYNGTKITSLIYNGTKIF